LEAVGDSLDRYLRRVGMPVARDLRRLVEEWASIAGEPWASRAEPVGLRDGRLVVAVEDGADATMLKYQVEELLTRLEEGLEGRLVGSVSIVVGKPKKRL
jgi:predicted nucleic acid-binding Zn ribbon protein